jgi:CDP-diacylglycerol--serine O-phosphatidyltransferase
MEQHKKNLKLVSQKNTRVILPNIFTLVGVCIGLSSIKFAFDARFELSVLAIIVAAVIDGLDGRIARLIKGTSKVGKELDSLTDVISFGVAPAFIMYFWKLNELGRVGWLICLIYVVCVVLRLARFNVSSSEESSWKDNFFEGIPSPAGGVLVLMPLIFSFSELQIFSLNYDIIIPALFIAISILMISKMPTYSFKRIVVQRSMTIFLLLGIVLYFGLILIYTFNTLVLSGIIYLIMMPISSVHYYKIKNKFKTQVNDNDNDDHEDIL